MPTTRRRTDPKRVVRKGNLRNAADLALSQVSKLVNLPVAQDVVRHIHQITIALKAPKTNDLSAKELADHVTGLLDVLDAVIPHLDDVAELDALYDRLQTARAELESIQASEYTTKLASQTRIREQITELKEEISRTVTDLTLRLLVVTLAMGTTDRERTRKDLACTRKGLARTHKATMRTHQTVARHRVALRRAERCIAISNQHIQELGRICQNLQRQGSVSDIPMRPTPGKSNLRNGALLALSQTAKHVNLPLVQDVARHIQRITLVLKPSIFQAPKVNDLNARELSSHVAKLLDTLDAVLPCLESADELEQIYNRLQDIYAELEGIRDSQYVAKLASQTRIQERIAQFREEISQTMVDLTIGLLVVTLVNSMQDRERTQNAFMRIHQDVARQQDALVCAEQRIQALEHLCAASKLQGGATSTWHIDGRNITCCVSARNGCYFFLHFVLTLGDSLLSEGRV
ncbi:hypothetical protein V565_160770 [Rhizoctonia solani 123E]|uniref:Uncharacterized protein n=1 Tax=Rhizoctonia solani 123E TaxID=1423351 RepID=A0A074RPQ5_9AGAM|nr:hypothetical protein V565_160770 [Rhizoctonia solani 123E]